MSIDVRLIQGDCLDILPTLETGSVDAVVTDPPYGIRFMGKAWDGADIENDRRLNRARLSQSHTNKRGPAMVAGTYNLSLKGNRAFGEWCEQWASACLRVLKPGGYLLSFGGTRTFHRLACALEDAGFEMRDTLCWLYGSGFPKGKGCLKPAWEPILLCRKPGPRVLPLGIDECRVPTSRVDAEAMERCNTPGSGRQHAGGGLLGQSFERRRGSGNLDTFAGRWPANLILDEEAAELLDEQSGERPASYRKARTTDPHGSVYGAYNRTDQREFGHHDTGGASRFFYCAKASRAEREAGLEGMPIPIAPDAHNLSSNACAHCGLRIKANGSGKKCECGPERVTVKLPPSKNSHPTVKPLALMRWLVKLVCPPGGLVVDPFLGSGTTGVACVQTGRRFLGIELDPAYFAIAEKRLATVQRELVFS